MSQTLAQTIAKTKRGTFVGLITTKKGAVRRGRVYGNDLIHTVVISGFSYLRMVERSLKVLETIRPMDIASRLLRQGHLVPFVVIGQAMEELKASFEATLAGTNESTTDHVYDELVVDGQRVPGSRVYKCCKGEPDKLGQVHTCHCRNCTGLPEAPLPGTIYLQGIKIFSRVLEKAPNGPIPAANSSDKTRAKNAIRHLLPVSRYVSYPLEPGGDWVLRVGGAAVEGAADATVEDAVVDLVNDTEEGVA